MAPANQPTTSPSKDDSAARLSDAALRKKKNADAQAAFRARRANYIATLEETGQSFFFLITPPSPLTRMPYTVTNLEAVVLQLQDSCREARAEATELRQENFQLKHAGREREKILESSLANEKESRTTAVNSHIGSALGPYGEDTLHYPNGNSPSAIASGPYGTPAGEYPTRSPSIPYASAEADHVTNNTRSHPMSHRQSSKYSYHPYPVQSAARDGAWPQPVTQTTSSGGESGRADSNSSHSPNYVESPHITSTPDMTYASRYPVVDEQKVPPNSMDNAPYIFTSRSMSPSTSTPPSSSSTSLTSPFQFQFPDGSVPQDRAEFDYRRHSTTGHPAEVTLHGGIADISVAGTGGSDAVRYRLGARRTNSGADRAIFPALPQFPVPDGVHSGDRGSSEGENAPYSRLRSRRGVSRLSRSPSPGTPPMSGTLAVIKAQAFGALRRTRARSKRGADGAAKVAIEALEARGIGMGVSTGSRRPRIHDDDDDDDTRN
ncbi:hypothetical protein EW146_g3735 [Bondarzewia mesenterica]|uniref:BZIP domain-containing protein n=1 Tax=Bondarzewia mesenterica TaxID=1095465 RepID=A0A4S4LX69_9AGAM|nr:hypothetical protein EW146_g3735 [Bondarzewia mesenterica]